MLIGSKASFGIEFEVDVVAIPKTAIRGVRGRGAAYGHLCFWADNRRIGDYEGVYHLSSATFGIKALLEYKGLRHEPTLWDQPTSVVFHIIHDALYVDSGQSDEQVALDSRRYSRLMAVPDGYEIFDDWKGYLIQGATTARYIWKYYHEPTIYEVILDVDEFDTRLQEYMDWYEANDGLNAHKEDA